MASVVALIALSVFGAIALAIPAVGVSIAYVLGILNPQAVWWWAFEGVRPVYLVLLPTLIGVFGLIIRGGAEWRAAWNVRTVCLAVLVITGFVSWQFGPYSLTAAADGELGTRGASFIVENLVKIVLLALVAVLVVKTNWHLNLLIGGFLASGLYLTWWINDRYLFHGAWGRIAGPSGLDGSGTYIDENVFSTLFVALVPFLWYAGLATGRLYLRWGLWFAIFFVWHAIFLTGSRGGLLALGVAMLVMVFRMKRRLLGGALIVLFVAAYAWQAGDTMWQRAATIDDYAEDESATGRIEAWKAGVVMMVKHPLTGVGPGAFLRAFPRYSDAYPRQAHNTFVQFGAEFGPLALVAIAVLVLSSLFSLWRIPASLPCSSVGAGVGEMFWREATLAALAGVSVAACFLSFQLFELMYFLIMLSCILSARCSKDIAESLACRGSGRRSLA